MERLAWIEILDRHGDVAVRHPVHAWPVRVGRAYSSDLVLDDPYVAANHLEINQADDGNHQVKILDSINGMTIDARRGKQTDATISGNNVVRIGQTQLRIRPFDYAVPAERLLPGNAWVRRWPAMIAGVLALLLTHLLMQWLSYDRDESYRILFSPLLGDIPLLLLWVGFWALIGRVLSGRANFIAHTVIASMGVALFMLLNNLLYGYVDFALDSSLMSNLLSGFIEPLIIGPVLYYHLCLVSRVSRRRLGIMVAMLLATLIGIGLITDELTSDSALTAMEFSRTIGPPSLLMVQGKTTEEFIAGANGLKSKVDE